MDYYKKLKTRSRTAVDEYKKLERKCDTLAAGTEWENRALEEKIAVLERRLKSKTVGLEAAIDAAKIVEENKKLKLRLDALNSGIRKFEACLSDEKKERHVEVENLNGVIDGLKCSLKIITRERGE